MINFCSLYSGSSGNCLFVETDNAKILIDAGMSMKKINEGLASINISLENIDAILVTHEHTDHIKGLKAISKKYNIPTYATYKTWDKLPINPGELFVPYEKFEIKDIEILPFSIPHDAADPCGFNIYNGDSKISIATDLGHVDTKIMSHLEGSSFMLLESNYDPEVLKCSSYPYILKKRIAGPTGHLSNYNAGQVISSLIHSGLKSVVLGHLSKENNFPELARETILEELSKSNYTANSIDLCVASRSECSKIISI